MMKTIATAIAGIMFVTGFALVDFRLSFPKSEMEMKRLKPSIEQLKLEPSQYPH